MAEGGRRAILPAMWADTETELKIPTADLDRVRRNLESLGGRLEKPMTREVNLLLDTDGGRLGAEGCVLRLRRYGDRQVLTFKGRPTYEGRVKSRVEHELEIADVDAMKRVLQALGFEVTMRYDKDRESWRVEDVDVVLDHTPMGDFVEVEGVAFRLEGVARALGLDPARAVRGSYPSLWHDHRRRHPDRNLPSDMVFQT